MADGEISRQPNPDARAIAADIQNNINLLLRLDGSKPPVLDALLNNPTTQAALDALHRDAMQLQSNGLGADGKMAWSPLQTGVLQELGRLEANGTLPRVNITVDGEIEAQQRLPNYFIQNGKGGPLVQQNTRSVHAYPSKPTTFDDYRPYDPNAPIPQIGNQHPRAK